MPERYVATDSRTGVEIAVIGEFPDDAAQRVRIARTINLFTRLLSTIMATENATEREQRFRSLELQLEMADALTRGDRDEVGRLMRESLRQLGVTDEQLREAERQLREQLRDMTGGEIDVDAGWLFGGQDDAPDEGQQPEAER